MRSIQGPSQQTETMASTQLRRSSSTNRLRRVPSLAQPITIHYEIQNHSTRLQRLTRTFHIYRLTVTTTASIFLGLIIGLVCKPHSSSWTERQFMYIELPGELYLRFLKLMIIPLLVSNVILSFGRIEGKISSHLGKIASVLYLVSNVIAIMIAILVVFLVCPGCKQTQSFMNHGRDKDSVINNLKHFEAPTFSKPNYFYGHQESIERYRDYHPMFYHTNREEPFKLTFSTGLEDVLKDQQSVIEGTSSSFATGDNKGHWAYMFSGNHRKSSSEEESIVQNVKATPFDPSSWLNDRKQSELRRLSMSTKLPIDVLLDVLRNLVPDSIIGATMRQTRTRLIPPQGIILLKNGTTDPPPSHWPMAHQMVNHANIIGLLAISVLIGIVLSKMEDAGKPLLDLCQCVAELSLRISMMAINLSPFCIMFLLIGQVARARDLSLMAGELCLYCLTIMSGLIVHGCILMPLIYYSITKLSPVDFFIGMMEALVASLATSSSSASMALTLRCLSDLKLHPVIVRAFGPLGLVFNMNGTTIYEVIGTIFIAQTLNIRLPFTSILLIGLSSIVASLSTSGIPSSGLLTMVIVLDTVNLPALQLSLIYIVDFIIDRFRTVINVWTGALVCGIVNSICPESLFEYREKEAQTHLNKLGYGFSNKDQTPAKNEMKPEVISVTITPPQESSSM